MSELQLHTVTNLNGGINLKDPDYLVADNELTGGKNGEISASGRMGKRNGYESAHSLSFQPVSVFRFIKGSTGDKYTIITGGTSYYHETTQMLTGLTSGQAFRFAPWLDTTVYSVNGKDGLIKDTGTAVTRVAAMLGVDLVGITNRMNRLWVCDNKYLYWSDLGDPDTFDSNSIIEIERRNGETVMGIGNILNNVAVYTDRNILVVRGGSDPNTYSLENLDTGYGIVGPGAICTIPGGQVGLGREGLFFFNGSNAQTFPGYEKIKPLLDAADPEGLQNAQVYLHNQKVYISYPAINSVYNDRVLVYDLVYQCFLPEWQGMNVNSFCGFSGVGDDNALYFASSNENYVFKRNSGFSDNGTSIEMILETKQFAVVSMDNPKKFKKARIKSENSSSNAAISYAIDGNPFVTDITIPLSAP